jgi:hypothetical protein
MDKKFRVWSNTDSKFVTEHIETITYSDGQTKTGNFGEYFIGLDGSLRFLNYDHLDKEKGTCIVQQFSGCCDQDKKEIYEGDIVLYKTTGKTGIVEFFAGLFVVSWLDQTDDVLGYLLVDSLKVVGNIHQNEDLLYILEK